MRGQALARAGLAVAVAAAVAVAVAVGQGGVARAGAAAPKPAAIAVRRLPRAAAPPAVRDRAGAEWRHAFTVTDAGGTFSFVPVALASPAGGGRKLRRYVFIRGAGALDTVEVEVEVQVDDLWDAGTLEGVGFRDLDGDGRGDVLTLSRERPVDPHGGRDFGVARVLLQRGDGTFALDDGATDRASSGRPPRTIAEATARVIGWREPRPPGPDQERDARCAGQGQSQGGDWLYRMSGVAGRSAVHCSGRAAISAEGGKGDRRCLTWRLVDPTCAGDKAVDWLHVDTDRERRARFMCREGAGISARICEAQGKGGWSLVDADPPGVGGCAIGVGTTAGGAPSSVRVQCDWRSREPPYTGGSTTYSLARP